jgi:hypothetical protein
MLKEPTMNRDKGMTAAIPVRGFDHIGVTVPGI